MILLNRKHIIVSGYWADEGRTDKADFFDLWWENTQKVSPALTVIVNAGAKCLPKEKKGLWIDCTENLGHVHHLITGEKKQKLCGWTVSTLVGALAAYNCNTDMIYKEQDCLCFGPWVDAIYKEAEEKKANMMCGKCDLVVIEQSLVWVRYESLLDYVKLILNMPEADKDLLPEFKYRRLIDSGIMSYLPFPGGRNRPLPTHERCWYAQQITAEEMKSLNGKI